MLSPEAYLQLSASNALYGEVGPNLVRLTGEFRDNTVVLQWVLLSPATEDEVEDYRCASTGIIADYSDALMEEDFVRVADFGNAHATKPLPVGIFSRNLAAER